MKVDHIGIAVRNLEKAIKSYENLGLKCESVEEIKEEEVKVAMFSIGESGIELLQSTSENGVIARFIENRGEGIHHLSFEVEDIGSVLGELRGKGVELVDERPRRGAHRSKIAFIHPKSMSGVLIELVEKHPMRQHNPDNLALKERYPNNTRAP